MSQKHKIKPHEYVTFWVGIMVRREPFTCKAQYRIKQLTNAPTLSKSSRRTFPRCSHRPHSASQFS